MHTEHSKLHAYAISSHTHQLHHYFAIRFIHKHSLRTWDNRNCTYVYTIIYQSSAMVSQPSAIILPSNLSMEYPEHCSMENNPSSNAKSHSTGQNIFQPFMEPKHSLLCLQEPTTGFCTQSFEFSRHPLSRIPFIVHFNNILPSTLRSPKWSLPSGF